MTRLFLCALASATALLAAPANAQSTAPTVETSARATHGWLDAPYHYDRPIHMMSANATVRTDDLDLATSAGQHELRRRIRGAAVAACSAIDSASADTLIDDEFTCVRQATRDARQQIEARR